MSKNIITLLLFVSIAVAENWAVLVVGSDAWPNYRHFADIGHAFQIVKRGGFKSDHIITMAYDDISKYPMNPFPGKIFNHPGNNQQNVWEDFTIDYRKQAVSGVNLMKILLGDESAGGKVLKTGPNDNIFLFYADHGNKGVLAFPGGALYAKDLMKTLHEMHDRDLYHHFVIYVEACYAGTMFAELPKDMRVVAVTAADDNESSWATYCGDEAVVDGVPITSCLGDAFAVAWMEDTDRGKQTTETLEEQFQIAVKRVTKSHVTRYGDVSFVSDTLDKYVGAGGPVSVSTEDAEEQYTEKWSAYESTLNYYRSMWESSSSSDSPLKEVYYKQYMNEVSIRSQIDRYLNSIVLHDRYYTESIDFSILDWDCYKRGVDQIQALFGNHEYAMKYYGVFANMCLDNPNVF